MKRKIKELSRQAEAEYQTVFNRLAKNHNLKKVKGKAAAQKFLAVLTAEESLEFSIAALKRQTVCEALKNPMWLQP
ncbi:MAG: hypothetical protein K8R48_04110 [Alphaproteobacteria bacterium]|nr:hypothetical protein [Alphaproteobacteria bacterium]